MRFFQAPCIVPSHRSCHLGEQVARTDAVRADWKHAGDEDFRYSPIDILDGFQIEAGNMAHIGSRRWILFHFHYELLHNPGC